MLDRHPDPGGNLQMRLVAKDLASLWPIPFPSAGDPGKVENALRERIKELNCLYGIYRLTERNPDSLDGLLKDLVDFLPYSWQYPEIACSRIILNGKTYTSENFEVTNWQQSSKLHMSDGSAGEVSVFYKEEHPHSDEGPFLKEERVLLDAVAEQIGAIATRMSAVLDLQVANRQLALEHKALQESNTALRVVLSNIEQEKQEIRRHIKFNVERILDPILHALADVLHPGYRKYVELLQANLDAITSPFINQLSRSYASLTPTEIAVCNMIRTGMSTKEIAAVRGVSEATIRRHREKIRSKLKITNRDVNLTTFLQSAMWDKP